MEATAPVEPASPEPALATEPCAHCGAALAHDQRYCLECGAPRTFLSGLQQLDGLRAAAAPAAYSPAAYGPEAYGSTAPGSHYPPGAPSPYGISSYAYPPAAPAASRWGSPAGLIAGVGVLLLAMGVGVLIGRSGSSSGKTPLAAPAQVITVDQSGGAAAGTETGVTQPAPNGAGNHRGGKRSHSSSGSGSAGKAGSGNGVGESIQHPAPPSVLKNEKSKTGGSFEQKSKNLPNVISTG